MILFEILIRGRLPGLGAVLVDRLLWFNQLEFTSRRGVIETCSSLILLKVQLNSITNFYNFIERFDVNPVQKSDFGNLNNLFI